MCKFFSEINADDDLLSEFVVIRLNFFLIEESKIIFSDDGVKKLTFEFIPHKLVQISHIIKAMNVEGFSNVAGIFVFVVESCFLFAKK